VENGDETIWYKRQQIGSRQYKEISRDEINTAEKMIGILGRLIGNQLRIYGEQEDLEVVSEGNESNEIQDNASDNRYPVEIDEAILNRRAVAVVDASVDE